MFKFLLDPFPIRSTTIKIIQNLELMSYKKRVEIGAVPRPHYGHCLYASADIARRMGLKKISAIEFGVAGGAGLVNLEYHAEQIEKIFDIEIEVYGFDTGKGLPKPQDYRDLPHHWAEGFYEMDQISLNRKLKRAKLVLGKVEDTVPTFFKEHNPAPIGALLFDLDFYSSTLAAFKLFNSDDKYLLPRIWCYMDDVTGNHIQAYSDYTGVRAAIHDYNDTNKDKKISPAYYLLGKKAVEQWHKKIWIQHSFKHKQYTQFVSDDDLQLPL